MHAHADTSRDETNGWADPTAPRSLSVCLSAPAGHCRRSVAHLMFARLEAGADEDASTLEWDKGDR